MRGPWSRKTPRRVSITPVIEKQSTQQLRKAKRLGIEAVSEKTNANRGT